MNGNAYDTNNNNSVTNGHVEHHNGGHSSDEYDDDEDELDGVGGSGADGSTMGTSDGQTVFPWMTRVHSSTGRLKWSLIDNLQFIKLILKMGLKTLTATACIKKSWFELWQRRPKIFSYEKYD